MQNHWDNGVLNCLHGGLYLPCKQIENNTSLYFTLNDASNFSVLLLIKIILRADENTEKFLENVKQMGTDLYKN